MELARPDRIELHFPNGEVKSYEDNYFCFFCAGDIINSHMNVNLDPCEAAVFLLRIFHHLGESVGSFLEYVEAQGREEE